MEKDQINFKEVGFRAQSKSELYRALIVEGELYLPPIKEASMLFISQIAIGDKKVNSKINVKLNILFIGIEICRCQVVPGSPHQRPPGG